jgi:23S rRNA (cytosine1962-C5)-methyltransferase
MMWSMDSYQLLDAGDGRRLERFGERLIDRPSPVAVDRRLDTGTWAGAELRFDRYAGWLARTGHLEPWRITFDGLTLELRPTETGQVGLFPEQHPTWQWLRGRVTSAGSAPVRVLNLFGYTGAATLAAADAGASVTHVDASRPSVAWARHNALLSSLADRPIRWLVDDAEAFVRREERRGSRYDGIVLDPPSYGHGAGGRRWLLEDRLDDLLLSCARLRTDPSAFIVLTAHTPGFDGERLAGALSRAFRMPARDIEAGDLELRATSGVRLPLGAYARWPR